MGCAHTKEDGNSSVLKKFRNQLEDTQLELLSNALVTIDELFMQAKDSIKGLKLAKQNFDISLSISSLSITSSLEKNLLAMLEAFKKKGKMIEFISKPPYFNIDSSSILYNHYKIFASQLAGSRKVLFDVLVTTQSYFKKNLREIIGDEDISHDAEANWTQVKKLFAGKYDKLFKLHNKITEHVGIIKRISVKFALLKTVSDSHANESDLVITMAESPFKSKLWKSSTIL